MKRANTGLERNQKALKSDPSQTSPACNTRQQTKLCRDIDTFMGTLIQLLIVERDIRVSKWRVEQAMADSLYLEKLGQEQRIFTGSFYEGMPSHACGDVDLMYTRKSFPTVLHHPIGQMMSMHIIAQGNLEQPAYLRLTVPDDMIFQSDYLNKSVIDYKGVKYLSSSAFVGHAAGEGTKVQGPARKSVTYSKFPEYGMADDVVCLVCPSWPPCAQAFFSRRSAHGWPTKSLQHHIQQAGCHVVGVGHQSTERRDLEWRWSFSVAEKELIHHMSPTVAGSMYVLKQLKKHTWKEDTSSDHPQAVCSYFFKVACLWTAELSKPADDVMTIVRKELDWLIHCYQAQNLPHYFFPKQNLIGHLPHDTCKEVATKLIKVKSQLWLEVLCSLTMDSEGNEVIKSLQVKLDLAPADKPTPENYRELLSTLTGCDKDKAAQALEETSHSIGRGSPLYSKFEHNSVNDWSAADYNSMHIIMKLQDSKLSDLMTVPDKIILPLIEKLPSVINSKHVNSYRSSLYRYLGDLYNSLYIYFKTKQSKEISPRLLKMCYQKSVKYHTKGIQMLYPDGCTDRGLSGYVHLAKVYYLNEEWDKVEGVMADLQPLLEEVGQISEKTLCENTETLNDLSQIVIDYRYDVCQCPWKGDRLLHCPLLERCTDVCVSINPAMLGFYIKGRLSLRKDRREGVEECIRRMEQTRGLIQGMLQNRSSQMLIEVLNTYLTVYDELKAAGFVKSSIRN